MAAMPVLKPLHDEAGLVRLIAAHVPGGVGRAGWPASTSSTSRSRKVVDRAAELTHDGDAVEFPAPEKFARPIAFNVLPLAGKLVDDGSFETDEEQKLRNESRKILDIPDLRGVGHVRAGAGVHRPLAVDQRRVRPADLASSGPPSCSPRRRASSLIDVPTPLEAAGTGPVLRRAHPPRSERVDDGRGLALFVSNDNLRKGAALNAVQIAELLL